MLTSGDFCEPTSRIPLSESQLEELDALTKPLGLNSVLDAKRCDPVFAVALIRLFSLRLKLKVNYHQI